MWNFSGHSLRQVSQDAWQWLYTQSNKSLFTKLSSEIQNDEIKRAFSNKILDFVPLADGDVSFTILQWCTSSILNTSVLVYGTRHGPLWLEQRPIWYDLVVGCYFTVTQGKGTTWQSQSLSRLNTWLLSSSWNPSTHLAIVSELWGHLPTDAMLTPAITHITGKLVESGSLLFFPVQDQRTCSLPIRLGY